VNLSQGLPQNLSIEYVPIKKIGTTNLKILSFQVLKAILLLRVNIFVLIGHTVLQISLKMALEYSIPNEEKNLGFSLSIFLHFANQWNGSQVMLWP
jgi:hypothetical protein